MQFLTDVMRWFVALTACFLLHCHSYQLRGPGPGYPPAMGHPGTRTAEMAPGPNNFTNYGWGSAYDPHRPGSLAQTPAPGETGAIPIFPFWFPPYTGAPIGVPPPDIDR